VRAFAYLVGFVCLEAMQCELVFFCPNGDSFDVELIGCPKYPDSNFRTIGDEDLFYRQVKAPGC